MDITVVFQIAAVGILVAVLTLVLEQAGKEELALLTSLAGLILVLLWIVQHINELFVTIQALFNL